MLLMLRSSAYQYGATACLVLVAAAIRWAAHPLLGDKLHFAGFIPAVVVATLLFGPKPGLLAVVMGFALGIFFILAQGDPQMNLDIARGGVFLSCGLALTWGTQKLKSKNEQVVHALEVAQRAREQMDRFIAVLGHELRNPLNGILLGSSVLLQRSGLHDDSSRAAQLIVRQARHMQKLIDELLDITRIEQGKVKLAMHPVDLSDVMRMCVDQQTLPMKAQGQMLLVHQPRHPVMVVGDMDRLVQVVANLLTNACKHSGPGSLIEATLAVERSQAYLEIRDNGPGIPADKLEMIFEPFMQIDQATSKDSGGLGLGLPTVKALVDLHAGTVSASNAPEGRGAIFTVRLPLRDQSAYASSKQSNFSPAREG